jgi:AraC family transcriptional regulator of arabinose operon
MMIPDEPPPPPYCDLFTGHYRMTSGYRTWREHGTPDWLLILTLDGQGRFGHAFGEDTIVGPGELVLLRPGTRHDYGIAGGEGLWELLWAHFQPRSFWTDWLRWPEAATGLMHLSLAEPIVRRKITTRFSEAHKLAIGALPRKTAFALNALEEVLLWCATQNPRTRPQPRDERVQGVLDYIHGHLAEKMTLAVLADQSRLSASRLSHLFRQQLGMTPQQYLETQRLLRAQQLLARTAHSVGEVAAQVGFENPFYFTLRFKRQTGLAPTEWRRKADALETAVPDADA